MERSHNNPASQEHCPTLLINIRRGRIVVECSGLENRQVKASRVRIPPSPHFYIGGMRSKAKAKLLTIPGRGIPPSLAA